MRTIVVVGNGIAGSTCARMLRKHNPEDRILMIGNETRYPYSRTALMYIHMGQVPFEQTWLYEPAFWHKNRIECFQETVTDIDFEEKKVTTNQQQISFDFLVLAMGSKSQFHGLANEGSQRIRGLYNLQDLEWFRLHAAAGKKAVIIGGGLIGVELAEMLQYSGMDVTILVKDAHFWGSVLASGEGKMVNKILISRGVKLLFMVKATSIQETGHECEISLADGTQLSANLVAISAGVSPNIEMIKNTKLDAGKGILVNEYLETSMPGVFAIGDVAELRVPPPGRSALEPVWYTGKMMGETVAKNICGPGMEAYRPGPWFNSARFYHLDYQVYGIVPAQEKEGISQFFWQNQEKSFRVCWEESSGYITGLQVMGMALRHKPVHDFLCRQTSVAEVISQLPSLLFLKEFVDSPASDIMKDFSAKTGIILITKSRRWWSL